MIGPFLVLIAIGLFYVANKGKSFEFLQAMDIFPGLSEEESKLGQFIGTWLKQNIWNNLAQAVSDGIKGILPFGLGNIGNNSSNNSSSSSNNLVHGYTIDLAGGGQMTVNSTSQAGAIADVISQGGTPASG